MTCSTRVSVNVKQKPVYCVQRNILTPKENSIHTETGNGYETQDQIFNLVIQAHQAIAWCFNFLIRFMKSSSPHCFSFQFSKFKKLTNYKETIVDIRKKKPLYVCSLHTKLNQWHEMFFGQPNT